MKSTVILLLLLGSLLCVGQNKSNPERYKVPAVITVDDIKAERVTDHKIFLDGSVHNSGDLPVKGGLYLYFDLQDVDGKTVTTRKGQVADSDFGPDDSTEFHYQLPDQARAVQVVVRAETKGNMYIEVQKGGPYWIE
jgi:hypothetical protein